jgi:hypothetical protein
MIDNEAGVQVQLNLLVLTKAELEVEVAKLEASLFFWGDLYQQVRSVYRQEIDKEQRRKSYFQTRRPSPPSSLRQWYFDADTIASEHDEGRGTDIPQTFTIPRKEVPIREMLARVKASSLFSPRLGTSQEYSWSESNNLVMSEVSNIRESGADSSTELGTTNHITQCHKRGDSGIAMGANTERANEKLRRLIRI